MDLIILARELGAEIQKSEEYIEYRIKEQNIECNENLQKMMEEFNLKKVSINHEISQENVDQEKIDKLNAEIGEIYSKIMLDETMKEFNSSKEKFENLLRKINYIISGAATGQDPYTIEPEEEVGCSGSCSSCSGCH